MYVIHLIIPFLDYCLPCSKVRIASAPKAQQVHTSLSYTLLSDVDFF